MNVVDSLELKKLWRAGQVRKSAWEKKKEREEDREYEEEKNKTHIATVKSRNCKTRKIVTQLPPEDVFIVVFFSVYINFIGGAKLDLFDTSFLCLLLFSVYVTFVRFVNDRDTTNRSSGSIAAYDAWFYEACYSFRNRENFIDFFKKPI